MNFSGPTLRVVLPKITVVYYTGFYELRDKLSSLGDGMQFYRREINTGEVRKSKVKLSQRENPLLLPPAYFINMLTRALLLCPIGLFIESPFDQPMKP